MQLLKNVSHVLYHIVIVVLSAAVALSLPFAARFMARKFLGYWALIENEKIFLISVEVGTAVLLIVLFNLIVKNMKSRKLPGWRRKQVFLRLAVRAGSSSMRG